MIDVSARSFFMSGVAAISAAAVALTPSLTTPVTRNDTPTAIQLSALVSPFDPGLGLSAMAAGQLAAPAVAGAAVLAPAAVAATSIGEAIENLYNTVEPWVQYGVNLTSWAVGWVPFIGLLAPQINFVYYLGEPIVQSLLFNSIDFLSGTISFSDALSKISTATMESINTFVNTEINWVKSSWPPFPPIGASMLTSLPLADTPTATTTALQESVSGLVDAQSAVNLTALVDPAIAAEVTAVSESVAALAPATALNAGAASVFSALSQIGADVGGILLSLIP